MTITTPSITRLHDEEGLPSGRGGALHAVLPAIFRGSDARSVSRIRAVVALRGVIAPCLGMAAVPRGSSRGPVRGCRCGPSVSSFRRVCRKRKRLGNDAEPLLIRLPGPRPENMTTNLNVAHINDGVSSQLNLPTGPVGLVRPRRERTDEDREWHSEQSKVKIPSVYYREVYRQMAFLGSCNPGRVCFAAHSTIARERGISVKTVQRAVKYLAHEGLIRCMSVGAGRSTGKYQILGRSKSPSSVDSESTLDGLRVHQIEEGIDQRTKKTSLSVNADAQTIDPGAVEEVEIPEEVICLPFPSQEQEQEQEKASAPVPKETVFVNENQVKLLFKLQRKLGYRADDGQAGVFDGLEHADRRRILDKLLAEEQLAAAQGKVPAPPKAAPSPRHEVAHRVVRKTVRERPTCLEHRWTPAASDGVQNCYGCDAEKTQD